MRSEYAKFKIETPEIDMIHPMIKLGLVDVFGDDANLSGMNGKKTCMSLP